MKNLNALFLACLALLTLAAPSFASGFGFGLSARIVTPFVPVQRVVVRQQFVQPVYAAPVVQQVVIDDCHAQPIVQQVRVRQVQQAHVAPVVQRVRVQRVVNRVQVQRVRVRSNVVGY